MNTTIFDRKIVVITPVDVMPSSKNAKMLYEKTGLSGSLPLFVVYGVLKGAVVKHTKSGESVKFVGDFETYNQITGEILKSDSMITIKLVENLLVEYVKTMPENGIEFGYSIEALIGSENLRDVSIKVFHAWLPVVHDPLFNIRATAQKFIDKTAQEVADNLMSEFEKELESSLQSQELDGSFDNGGVHYDLKKVDEDLKFRENPSSDSCEVQAVSGYGSDTVSDSIPKSKRGVNKKEKK